jgi:hypothetical protein
LKRKEDVVRRLPPSLSAAEAPDLVVSGKWRQRSVVEVEATECGSRACAGSGACARGARGTREVRSGECENLDDLEREIELPAADVFELEFDCELEFESELDFEFEWDVSSSRGRIWEMGKS